MSGLYDYRWQQARAQFLRDHPLCALCEARGIVEAATVVDHVIPHKGDPVLFWNQANWQSLSKRCHDSRKQMLESGDKVPPHPSWGGAGKRSIELSLDRHAIPRRNSPHKIRLLNGHER